MGPAFEGWKTEASRQSSGRRTAAADFGIRSAYSDFAPIVKGSAMNCISHAHGGAAHLAPVGLRGLMMKATYRMMRPEDRESVFALVERGFDQFVRADFAEEGIAEFARAARLMVFEQPPEHFVMVAEGDDHIVGMIDMRDHSHICLFFVEPSCIGKGIGRGLLGCAVAECRKHNADLQQIDVNSSLWAVPVYRKLGFRQRKPEQIINGIRFVEMVKELED
jgi:GNAT superfamily N-acetyltransferase